MKDFNDMTAKEMKAYKNIKNAACDYVYSIQNGCYDSQVDSEEYNDYYNHLNDLDALVDAVYVEAISAVYTDDGTTFGGSAAKAYIKDIRFCGKEFLMEVTRHFCKKYQEEVLVDLLKSEV